MCENAKSAIADKYQAAMAMKQEGEACQNLDNQLRKPSIHESVYLAKRRANDEVWKLNNLNRLEVLLKKNPEVAEILDLIQALNLP